MPGFLLFLLIFVLIGGCAAYVIITTKKALQLNTETWVMKLWKKPGIKAIAASLISILGGMLIGCIILVIMAIFPTSGVPIKFNDIIKGIQLIFFGIFKTGSGSAGMLFGFNGQQLGNMLFRATPLILTGLSVAVAFKTGLFNIGAPGQYLVGTAATLILALVIPTEVVPSFFVWIIAFLGGILAGALWGAVPGLFKSLLNINEVITCIMMNWIAANVVTSLFDKTTGPFKFLLDPSGTKNLAFVYKTITNGVVTSKMGLDKIFANSQVNGGIIIAIVIAIVVHIVINKTTFGYELKACGSNKHAAKYAGINEKTSAVISMAIAGGLSGAAAALYWLSGNTEFAWSTYQTLPAIGFNGIPVALLAYNNPLGVIFSSIFMSTLDVNGMQLKYSTNFNEYITSIISALIVYFSAFSLLIQQVLNGNIKINLFKNKKNKLQPVEAPAQAEVPTVEPEEANDKEEGEE